MQVLPQDRVTVVSSGGAGTIAKLESSANTLAAGDVVVSSDSAAPEDVAGGGTNVPGESAAAHGNATANRDVSIRETEEAQVDVVASGDAAVNRRGIAGTSPDLPPAGMGGACICGGYKPKHHMPDADVRTRCPALTGTWQLDGK